MGGNVRPDELQQQQQDVALGLRLNLASRTLVQERQDKNANAIMLCSSPHCTPSVVGLKPGSGSLAPAPTPGMTVPPARM